MLTTNLGTTTTYFIGNYYEVSNGVVTKYYYAGAQRVAMRTGSTLSYLLSDHLGSTSITTNSSGALVSELRYKAWGETRYSSGSTATKYQYTGQYSYEGSFGLYYYGARWYDDTLGRFAQADTIVPAGVQGYDRYAYGNNSPLVYVDPSGHDPWWCSNLPCYDKYNRGNNRIAFMGGFKAGVNVQSLGQQAEDNWTGGVGTTKPVGGVAPEVPLIRGQEPPDLPDPSGPAGLASDIGNAIAPSSNDDVFLYLGYTKTEDGVSVNKLYIYNNSDSRIYLANTSFIEKNLFGQITQAYKEQCFTSCLKEDLGDLNGLYDAKIESHTNSWYAYGNNTFKNAAVEITAVIVDPWATIIFRPFKITLTNTFK